MKTKLAGLLLLTSLCGCMSIMNVATNFDQTKVASLKPGMTEKEVVHVFGVEPKFRTYNTDGSYKASWVHSNYGVVALFNDEHGAKMVELQFSKEGILKDITPRNDKTP